MVGIFISRLKPMPQPRDLTDSIYKSRKLKSTTSVKPGPMGPAHPVESRIHFRRLGFSVFSFAVALLLFIAILGQFVLMGLFRWL